MLDLIETRSESPENIKRIKFVKRSTNSLRQIIDDILDITRLRNGRIELKLSTSPELANVIVNGDEFRIEQVSNNLVSNAIKFAENGTVDLRLSVDSRGDDWIRLGFSVSDTGVGIKNASAHMWDQRPCP